MKRELLIYEGTAYISRSFLTLNGKKLPLDFAPNIWTSSIGGGLDVPVTIRVSMPIQPKPRTKPAKKAQRKRGGR